MTSLRPRKRFGQNFLRDEGVIERLVAAINPDSGEYLLEIGPGQGALTVPLLQSCGHLDVIEIDRDLVQYLNDKLGDQANLSVHQQDALKLSIRDISENRVRVVGNLPYNISTPLLFHLLDQSSRIIDMHFMLQREVVDRICAQPGSRTYGRLSVTLQLRCDAQALFEVAPESFYPPPRVYSQIVRLRPLAPGTYDIQNTNVLNAVVQAAFSQRRKTLRNSLKKWMDNDQLERAGVDPAARPETLSPASFVALANQISD